MITLTLAFLSSMTIAFNPAPATQSPTPAPVVETATEEVEVIAEPLVITPSAEFLAAQGR